MFLGPCVGSGHAVTRVLKGDGAGTGARSPAPPVLGLLPSGHPPLVAPLPGQGKKPLDSLPAGTGGARMALQKPGLLPEASVGRPKGARRMPTGQR